MKIAVYPGSFDPITKGHLDMIERATKIFDKVIVCVMVNSSKNYLFTCEERVALIKDVLSGIENVEVDFYDGLLIDYVRMRNSNIIVKGLRAFLDFEYEFQLAQMNRQLAPETETFFLVTDARYSYLSSRGVKEVFSFGGAIQEFVPPGVYRRMRERITPRKFTEA